MKGFGYLCDEETERGKNGRNVKHLNAQEHGQNFEFCRSHL